jgi:hypothetical protein
MLSKSLRELYIYALFITITTPVVGHPLFNVWTGIAYRTVVGIADTVQLITDGAARVEVITVFGLGPYFTWLFLFANGFRKH